MKDSLRRLIDGNGKAALAFKLTIQSLIMLSLVTFSVETLPSISEHTRWLLRAIEVGTVSIFTVEYLLRLFVTERKLSFVFSFYGIVDLLAILPFRGSRLARRIGIERFSA